MRSFMTIVFLFLLLTISGAAPSEALASQTGPSPDDVPEMQAPFGLGTVLLPTDSAGIAELFARLPPAIAGEVRSPTSEPDANRLEVPYGVNDGGFGPPLSIQAQNIATGDFFPAGFTADQFVATVSGVPDYSAEAFGRDGTLFWVQAATTVGVAGDKPGTPTVSRPIYTLAWGTASSPWLFSATSFNREGLELAVHAFVDVAASAATGATPSASPATDATPAS